ncbi:MAG: hypothetical protein ABJA02_14470, partial [Acidobacteriota bacterium]
LCLDRKRVALGEAIENGVRLAGSDARAPVSGTTVFSARSDCTKTRVLLYQNRRNAVTDTGFL